MHAGPDGSRHTRKTCNTHATHTQHTLATHTQHACPCTPLPLPASQALQWPHLGAPVPRMPATPTSTAASAGARRGAKASEQPELVYSPFRGGPMGYGIALLNKWQLFQLHNLIRAAVRLQAGTLIVVDLRRCVRRGSIGIRDLHDPRSISQD